MLQKVSIAKSFIATTSAILLSGCEINVVITSHVLNTELDAGRTSQLFGVVHLQGCCPSALINCLIQCFLYCSLHSRTAKYVSFRRA